MSGLKRTFLILIEEPLFWTIILIVLTLVGVAFFGRSA